VHEMPDARTFADLCALIDDGAGVLVVGHGVSCVIEHFSPASWLHLTGQTRRLRKG
jgi:hypothetical protein